MLRTLDSYIPRESGAGLPTPLGSSLFRERRFSRLLAFSVILHLVLYAVVVRLDIWVNRHYSVRKTGGTKLVKMIDLAPPSDRLSELRRPPDPIERADPARLQFDADRADDLNLVSRSPKPTVANGNALRLPYQTQFERHSPAGGAGEHVDGSSAPAAAPSPAVREQPRPPITQAITPASIPRSDAPTISQTPVPQAPGPAPPAPRPAPSPQGSPRGDAAESVSLGLQTVGAQYMAYVRAKIILVNEKIMPRTWIADVLNKKVSADFEVKLARGGRLLSAHKIRSSGYPRLDDVANDAIYMASPFEGFPTSAGEAITLTVTVYYTPWK